ncbi:recombinase family protein [Citreimonas salinaria]|uniref:recombinase family protein n=1 Tax=Citreimonas salinaria TaxID=321339 RepID=UPI000B7E7A68
MKGAFRPGADYDSHGHRSRGRLHTSAFGYRSRESETGLTREINPDEAGVVLRIFCETAERRSVPPIARGLNEGRLPAPKDASTIRGNRNRQERILNNRLYLGPKPTRSSSAWQPWRRSWRLGTVCRRTYRQSSRPRSSSSRRSLRTRNSSRRPAKNLRP